MPSVSCPQYFSRARRTRFRSDSLTSVKVARKQQQFLFAPTNTVGWLKSCSLDRTGKAHCMKPIITKTFCSLGLMLLLVSLNGCIVTHAVHKAITVPVKVVTSPL